MYCSLWLAEPQHSQAANNQPTSNNPSHDVTMQNPSGLARATREPKEPERPERPKAQAQRQPQLQQLRLRPQQQ